MDSRHNSKKHSHGTAIKTSPPLFPSFMPHLELLLHATLIWVWFWSFQVYMVEIHPISSKITQNSRKTQKHYCHFSRPLCHIWSCCYMQHLFEYGFEVSGYGLKLPKISQNSRKMPKHCHHFFHPLCYIWSCCYMLL